MVNALQVERIFFIKSDNIGSRVGNKRILDSESALVAFERFSGWRVFAGGPANFFQSLK
jgi:hypothetical protein